MKSSLAKLILASSLVANLAFAEGAFVGFDGVASKTQIELKDDFSNSYKMKDTAFGLGIKGGYDFDAFRVYGEYIYGFGADQKWGDEIEYGKDKITTHQFLIGADYTPRLSESFKLVFGAYTGASVLKIKGDWTDTNMGESGTGKWNKTGWLIGGKIGGIYELNSNNELEFGFKTDYTSYGKRTDEDNDSIKIKGSNYGLYLGYNFKF